MARGGVDKTIKSPKAKMPKKCPECGLLNKYLVDKCRKCGAQLPERKLVYRCPKCGEDSFEDDPKCSGCGLPMEEVKAKGQVYAC